MNIQQAKSYGKEKLIDSPSPVLDTEVFLQHILKVDRSFLLFHREEELTSSQEETFKAYIEARTTGLPVAYLTGTKEFFGYNFLVTPAVLIPKPDTEILVEKAIDLVVEKYNSRPNHIVTLCDMCTGSGCIGISVLKFISENNLIPKEYLPSVLLADISDKALDVAKQNADQILSSSARNQLQLVRTNLFQMIGESFDFILTNPPYIPAKEARDLLLDGRSEPLLALDGDITLEGKPTGENDGLGIIRNLIPQAKEHLSPQGQLLMETGEYNAEMTAWLFKQEGFGNVRIYKDLEGQLRDVHGILP